MPEVHTNRRPLLKFFDPQQIEGRDQKSDSQNYGELVQGDYLDDDVSALEARLVILPRSTMCCFTPKCDGVLIGGNPLEG